MAGIRSSCAQLLPYLAFIVALNFGVCSGRHFSSIPRIEDAAIIRKEALGNSTFDCTSSGPCLPCTYSEKGNDRKYHCSTYGYRQHYKCVEVQPVRLDGVRGSFKEASEGFIEHSSADNPGDKDQQDIFVDMAKDGQHVYRIFMSCLPAGDNERLGVLGFEGIILGMLAVSAS
eukprot:c20085_g2_i2 orf=1-516(-)